MTLYNKARLSFYGVINKETPEEKIERIHRDMKGIASIIEKHYKYKKAIMFVDRIIPGSYATVENRINDVLATKEYITHDSLENIRQGILSAYVIKWHIDARNFCLENS